MPIDILRVVPDSEPGPDAQALRSEELQRLETAIAALSPEQREVVELAFLFGLSQKEISEVAHCPLGTVKTRLFHARKHLRETLTEREIDGAAS